MQAAPERKALDLNTLRPVVASAVGASTTTTPSSTVRWQQGQAPLPLNAQAYAAFQKDQAPAQAAAQASASQKAALQARIEAPAPAAPPPAPVRTASLKAEVAKAESPEPRKIERPAVTGWVIQLGATDDEAKAKAMLDAARGRSGKLLAKASPFTEKVAAKGSTLYRARFSGFNEADDAEKACKALKRSGFSCFASRV
jgi:D-alanyl-D-alanine carboxypeptidase